MKSHRTENQQVIEVRVLMATVVKAERALRQHRAKLAIAIQRLEAGHRATVPHRPTERS
jgi:hypothetical protein